MPSYKDGTGVRIRIPTGGTSLGELSEALYLLADVEVLAGVPSDTAWDRPPEPDGKTPLNNAELAYIHDNGAPEAHIPARPFMRPGIRRVETKLANLLRRTAGLGLRTRDAFKIEASLHEVGITAQLSIQNVIREGIPPPLAESTLLARARKRPGRIGPGIELLRRSRGYAPSTEMVKPLIDTASMLKAISYVIRSRKRRGRG